MSKERSAFSLAGLPEWVKSFGLSPDAEAAIDRYWKPAWDEIKDALPLLPTHADREPSVGDGDGAIPLESICFEAVDEPVPGERWHARFKDMWPAYRSWYLQQGEEARPDLASCRSRLAEHMPELVPTYERLVKLAGGDELAARCLSLWHPPGFIVGCSQAVWTRGGGPVLVRNYDYPASRLEGVVIRSKWAGREIIGMSDCLWGLLDGINHAGLAVSLTFGGSPETGEGFAIPLVVRYLLETCDTVAQARMTLQRVPINAAQNLSLLDRGGEFATAYLGPDHPARFVDTPATTNHQGSITWPEYARAVRSVEREQHLLELLASRKVSVAAFADAFLQPPLHTNDYSGGMGTLYTAAYIPADGRVEYRWPGYTWKQSFRQFRETRHTQTFPAAQRP